MLKRASKAASSSTHILRPSCPACHLSTRPTPALLHSNARALAGAVQRPRADHLARAEYFSSSPAAAAAAATSTAEGAPRQGSLRSALTFQSYKSRRDATRPGDIPLDGRIPTTLPSLLQVFQYMTAQGQQPSKSAYWELMEAAVEYSRGRNGEDLPALREAGGEAGKQLVGEGEVGAHERTGLGWKVAWSAWRDARAGGIDLGVRGFELLLEAARPHPHLIPSLLYHAQNNPAIYQSITSTTYDFLLRSALASHRFETVLKLTTEMRMRGITALPHRMSAVVALACRNAAPRVALEVAEAYERLAQREVEAGAWADILRASAECHFVRSEVSRGEPKADLFQMAGIETAWDRLVESSAEFKPDEGLLILILNAAARHGNPSLATSCLAQFHRLGIQGREYHYAPVLEALCATGSLPEALQILDTMRIHGGVEPNLATARPLVDAMVAPDDIKWVDAGFDALEGLHIKGQRIDPAAFNAVLKAAEEYGDLKRAVVIYRQAGSFGVVPNIETFNTLLSACVKLAAKDQAQLILTDMEHQLGATTKDADTYAHLIELYLTQKDYEPAFHYLEEMKAARHRPSLSTYEAIARTCWTRQDERFKLVLEEMQMGGYKPSRPFLESLKSEADEARQWRPRAAGEVGGGAGRGKGRRTTRRAE